MCIKSYCCNNKKLWTWQNPCEDTHTETAAVSFKNVKRAWKNKKQNKSSTCYKHVQCTPTSTSRRWENAQPIWLSIYREQHFCSIQFSNLSHPTLVSQWGEPLWTRLMRLLQGLLWLPNTMSAAVKAMNQSSQEGSVCFTVCKVTVIGREMPRQEDQHCNWKLNNPQRESNTWACGPGGIPPTEVPWQQTCLTIL